jgi:hypothetical protein
MDQLRVELNPLTLARASHSVPSGWGCSAAPVVVWLAGVPHHPWVVGLDITLIDASKHRRLDMAVRFNGPIYLLEFKVVELSPEGKVLQQIKDRGYADKYRAEGLPIDLIGVEFSREKRGVVGLELEGGSD